MLSQDSVENRTHHISQMSLDILIRTLPSLEKQDRLNECLEAITAHLKSSLFPLITYMCKQRLEGTREGLMYDVNDVLQELLVKIWLNAQSFRGTSPESAQCWCARIVGNWLKNVAKKAVRRKIFMEQIKEIFRDREVCNLAPEFSVTLLDEIENGNLKGNIVAKLKKIFAERFD